MRLFVKRSIAIRRPYWRTRSRFCIQFLNFRRNIEKALRSQKEAVTGPRKSFCHTQEAMQFGMRVASAKSEIPGAAFRVETARNRNGFEKR